LFWIAAGSLTGLTTIKTSILSKELLIFYYFCILSTRSIRLFDFTLIRTLIYLFNLPGALCRYNIINFFLYKLNLLKEFQIYNIFILKLLYKYFNNFLFGQNILNFKKNYKK
jgi:hypothetical protein